MNLFDTVKATVSVREAAQLYGIEVHRNGMACCPFHDDKTPSMKVDKRFHCFGCGADGDVITFTSRLYQISSLEAARKLASDFGLSYDNRPVGREVYQQQLRRRREAQLKQEKENSVFNLLAGYARTIRDWEERYAPSSPEGPVDPRFSEAIRQKDRIDYMLDVLTSGSAEEKEAVIAENKGLMESLEQRRNLPMAEKQTNKERLREITDSIEQGILDLFQSDKYRQYLSVMSRFHRYSTNNTMLIYMQKPNASLVAGYNKWIDQFERHVKKGEHGITIIAPTPFKKKIEEQKLDPDTKAPMLDKDGNIITEEKVVEIPMFRPVKVFDVSQTDGKPLPNLVETLTGNVQNYDAFVEALRRSSPVPIAFTPMSSSMDGYFMPDQQRIALRSGMSEVQTISAAVHEIAHSLLHNKEIPTEQPQWKLTMVAEDGTRKPYLTGFGSRDDAEISAEDSQWQIVDEQGKIWTLEIEDDVPVKAFVKKDRNTEEVEAESVSYAVCQYYGIETGENSFGYIASWSRGKGLPELKNSLETINKTADGLITAIDRNFREICKERGIDKTAEEAHTAPPTVEYRVRPNLNSHNELDRSIVQAFTITGDQAQPGAVLGAGRTERCETVAKQLNIGGLTEEEARAYFEHEASAWHCYVVPDILSWNSAAVRKLTEQAEKTVGRIDFLGSDGNVGESIEYQDPALFEQDIRQENFHGSPMKVVLYRDREGSVIPHDFIAELDPPLQGMEITDNPALSRPPAHRTPIEFYDTYEEAVARFRELRTMDYNSESPVQSESGQPCARLTFGIQRENPPSAADLLHVRAGQNYLVDDFTRMDAISNSPQAMDVLERMNSDLGFDRALLHEKDEAGRYLPPVNTPFSEWVNDYFHALPEERLDLIGGSTYLHLQSCDEGYQYTLYDAESMRELDGGLLDNPDLSLASAEREISQLHELDTRSIENADLALIADFQATAGLQRPSEPLEKPLLDFPMSDFPSTENPHFSLDEYPLPDTTLSREIIQDFMAAEPDLLPLSRAKAEQLLHTGLAISLLQPDTAPATAVTDADLERHSGAFAISREEWQRSAQFAALVDERKEHQPEREQAFLDYPADCFAIYQIKQEDPDRLRYMNMDWLKQHQIPVSHDAYDLVYTAPLRPQENLAATLDGLYTQFNLHHPADYHSPSMSVSDIVALKQDGVVSCHYVDSIGFQDTPDFLRENPLKAAEMAVEDDYDMIDGIINNGPKEPTVQSLEQQARSGQPISLTALAEAVHREDVKKKQSVVAKLRSAPQQERRKPTQKKKDERAI